MQMSSPVEPGHYILRLAGGLGVASAEVLRLTALELCAYQKDVIVDWSGATQFDAGVAQVLPALRAAPELVEQNRSFAASERLPPAVEGWYCTAGLPGVFPMLALACGSSPERGA